MAFLAGLAGGAGSAGAAAGAGAGAGAAGAAGAGAAGAAGTAGAAGAAGAGAGAAGAAGGAGAAVGGQSLAAGGAMSAAPPASTAATTQALATTATATGASAAAPTSAAAAASPGVGGGMQGLVGSLLGNKSPGQAGGTPGELAEAAPTGSAYDEFKGIFSSMGSKLHGVQKGFLGLSDEDRNSLFMQSISSARQQYLGSQGGGGEVQPIDQSTGFPMMADGGDVSPGGSAVVGEQGPEVVTAQPGGGATVTPHPTGQPQAAPTAPVRAGQPPQESGLWPHIGAHIEDALIFASALRDPSIFVQMRNMKYQRQMALAQMGAKDPDLLRNPTVASAVDSFLGPGTAYDKSAEGHNERIGKLIGLDIVPEGTQLPDGTVAPSKSAQVVRRIVAEGGGAKIDEKGYVIPNFAAASVADRASAFGWNRQTSIRDMLIQNGHDWGSANTLAANQAIREMAQMNLPPPRELISLGLGDLTAEQAQEGRDRASMRNVFGLSRERTAGREVGGAAGRAEVAKEATRIPLGASPAPELRSALEGHGYTIEQDEKGNTFATLAGAVNLGKITKDDPRLVQLEQQGYRVSTDPAGNMIATPPGGIGPGTRPGALTMKAGDIKLFNSLRAGIGDLQNEDYIKRLPSEKSMGRGMARVTGRILGPAQALFEDPAEMNKARARLAEMRASAEKLYQGTLRGQYMVQLLDNLTGDIENRRATQEEWRAGMSVFNEMVEALGPSASLESEPPLDAGERSRIEAAIRGEAAPKQSSVSPDEQAFMDRIGKGEFGGGKPAPTARETARSTAKADSFRKVGGTLRNMETELQRLVDQKKMTKEQAVRKLQAAMKAGLPEE